MIQIATATLPSSDNYQTNIFYTAGSFGSESTNFQSITNIDADISGTTTSTNYNASLGLLSTFLFDKTAPTVTLSSPEDMYSSGSSEVTYEYVVADLHIKECSLWIANEKVKTETVAASGTHSITYTTTEEGSTAWFISCKDKGLNEKNSSVRTIVFPATEEEEQDPAPAGGSGRSETIYDESEFGFLHLNEFLTSYIHRNEHLPLPNQTVNFWVYLTEASQGAKVEYHYSHNKQDWTTLESIQEMAGESYSSPLGGYPPHTMIYYYVTATLDGQTIRTPAVGYDLIVWDNPPVGVSVFAKVLDSLLIFWSWIKSKGLFIGIGLALVLTVFFWKYTIKIIKFVLRVLIAIIEFIVRLFVAVTPPAFAFVSTVPGMIIALMLVSAVIICIKLSL